jgi:hypothetical protein
VTFLPFQRSVRLIDCAEQAGLENPTRRSVVVMNGPLAAEVVGTIGAAAAVVYVVGLLLLVCHIRSLRNFERPDHWVKLALLWPKHAAVGVAALTLEATNRSAGRRSVVEGER